MVEKMSELGQTSRAANALLKRQEAIKRWKSSDTNREPVQRTAHQVRITFDRETVFLSAVSSGDVDETRNLLNDGVDIDCANVDGLTALHQACIDENAELVDLLVIHGAFLDARDDEGWTPLHAAASAGNVEIAQLLIDNGADILAVNNEGEIPVDLAEEKEMEEFLEEEMEKLGVEIDDIRNQEEKIMMEDATSWVNSKNVDEQYNFQGASALHVAAAKGYMKVMRLLLQAGCDVNRKDKDGWSPLHAAVHWAQQPAAEALTEAGADFGIRNNIGQTPVDVAEGDMIKFVEELRKKAKGRSKDQHGSNRIIDQKGSRIINDVNDNDQSNVPFDGNALPLKSALKGGRDKFNGKASMDMNDSKSSIESESEGESEGETESEPESKPKRSTNPIIGGPLRPSSLTRPPTTATNEKVSTPRNPLITSAPLRPSSLINRDNEKRDDSKSDYSYSRDIKKDSENVNREPIRFNIPRPRDKLDDKESAVTTTIIRPGKTEDTKKDDLRLKFNIPRPRGRNDEKEDTKAEESKPRVSRFSRSEEKDDENKRPLSKADEIRAKFNIPKPGDSLASSALNRYRERNSENEESRQSKYGNDEDKKQDLAKTDDPIASLRARRALLTGPLRPSKSSDTTKEDKVEIDVSSLRSRLEHDKETDREETISIRKKFGERKDAEKEKEVEKKDEKKDDEDEDEDSANLSAQRARRSRRPREKRKATGVAYMPDEDDDVEEEKKETRYNTKVNEDNETKRSDSSTADDDAPKLSIAERLRRSRESRDATSSSSNVTSSLSSRNRDLTSSSSTKTDSNDPRELQRRLHDALNEVDEYKSKLEKANKEKEDLREKLAQCEEAMKKMKEENGALIRVISTLTRSNAS